MKKWIIYCEEKNKALMAKEDRIAVYDDVILEILKGDFFIFTKITKTNGNQKRFLVKVKNYPIEVPFNEWQETIQLITLFPNRNFK